jgi:hypothetical protein
MGELRISILFIRKRRKKSHVKQAQVTEGSRERGRWRLVFPATTSLVQT